MKKHLWLAIRLIIAALGVGYIVYALQWRDFTDAQGNLHEGVLTTIRQANLPLLLLGLALTAILYPLLTLRWWVLMRARGLGVPYGKAFRLTMVGCFFNFCMPGTTGGDLVKVFYVTKGSGRKTDAVMSMLVDRGEGLMGLVLLAGITSLFMRNNEIARQVLTYIGLLLAVGLMGACIYFSHSLRRMMRVDAILGKLPGVLAKVDQAVLAYRNHLGAIAASTTISLTMHLILAVSATVAVYALGAHVPVGLMLCILPVLFICAAIPISPQGLGTTEALGALMLVKPGLLTINQTVGMLMIWRLYQMFYAMFGSLYLLKGDIHLHPERDEAGEGDRVQGSGFGGQRADSDGEASKP